MARRVGFAELDPAFLHQLGHVLRRQNLVQISQNVVVVALRKEYEPESVAVHSTAEKG